jgi:class 3 adenylate cyclase
MTLTFLLTDVEGSTRLWEADREAMGRALARHDRLVETSVANHRGRLVKTKGEGDSTFNVFTDPAQAVAAALELQRALAVEPWAVRVAVHTGEVQEREADFFGPVVNRCARLRGIGHGGQTLLSAAAAELVRDELPDGASLRDLGRHRLKDLAAPEHVFQLCHPGLRDAFPPLSSLEARPNNLPLQLTRFIGRDSELAQLRQQLSAHRLGHPDRDRRRWQDPHGPPDRRRRPGGLPGRRLAGGAGAIVGARAGRAAAGHRAGDP